MRTGYRVRRAVEPDIAEIMDILQRRRAWLREVKLSDQWASVAEWRQLLVYLLRHGNVWVLVTDDEHDVIVGTVTVGTDADVDFWTDDEREQPALYVSKLATDVDRKGDELGRELLDWVLGHAEHLGVARVRLDTWKTSPELQHYYASRGWTYLRTADVDHRQSGALFEHGTRAGRACPDGQSTLTAGPRDPVVAAISRR